MMFCRGRSVMFALVLGTVWILSRLSQSEAAQGRAIIKIKLKRFDSRGDDSNGDPCDLSIWGGRRKCDPKFDFCVDKYSGSSSMGSCAYFEYKTSHFTDEDVINFSSRIKGMANPITVSVKNYEGIRFKVDVDDKDDVNSDDDIDKFDWRDNRKPDRGEAVASGKRIRIEGKRSGDKARLEFDFWVYCDDNSYGDDCSVFCEPVDADSVGHYGCNASTGQKYCLDGWENLDENCLIKLDNCEEFSCANNGVCHDEYNSFRCECRDGFTGERCEVNIDDCESGPCLNGGSCLDLVDSYTCSCTQLYTGDNCSLHVCEHPSSFCQNGGTCYERDNNTVGCVCPQQYAGIHCDVHACDLLNCDHGQCVDGVCVCDAHFIGGLCDVRECEQFPCQSNGTCLGSGECECQPGRTGRFCENLFLPCESQPCFNDADCVDSNDGVNYECRCQTGYNGTLCENEIPVVETVDPVDPQGRQDDESNKKKEGSAMPHWVLGLVIAVAILCLIIVVIVTLLLKYRRKYKKSVENPPPRSPRDMDNFVNPLYSENQTTISYSASAATATINTTTERKKPLDDDDADFGAAAPPPYTPHPEGVSSHPLPSYEQSQAPAPVGFLNLAFDGTSGKEKGVVEGLRERYENPYEDLDSSVLDRGYDNPTYVNSPDTIRINITRNNGAGNAESSYAELGASRRCMPPSEDTQTKGEPLYAQVPAPRPVTTANAGSSQAGCGYATPRRGGEETSAKVFPGSRHDDVTGSPPGEDMEPHMLDNTMTENELNASLEGSQM